MDGPVFVKTDGSVRDENHPDGPSAAIGYVIEDNGTRVSSGSEYITGLTDSSCAAEYIALERALQELTSYGFAGHLFVKTDSKNMANILNGNASPRTEETHSWIQQIKSLLTQFDGYTVSKTERSFNVEAHNLANRGHNQCD